MRNRFVQVGAMCWLLACGGAQPSAKELAVGSATSSAQLPPPAGLTGEEAEANAPAKLSSLETLVPADARLVVGLPSFEALWGDQAEAMRSGPLAGLARDWLQRELGLDAALIDLALKNYAGAVVLVRGEQGYGLVLRLREDISDKLAEAFKLKKTGPDSWNLPKGDGEGPINVDRVPGSNILMVTLHETLRSDMLARAAGKGEAFKRGGSAETVAAGEKGLWVSSNLAATLQENAFADRGSRFDGALSRGELRFDSVLNGSAVPRLGQLLEPAAHKGLMELPDGAVGGMSVSLRRKQGKTVSDLLAELGRMDDSDVVQLVGERLAAIGKLTLADVERGLGDELALGAYVAPGTKLDGDLSKGALVIAIATRDDALAKTAVDVFGAAVANNKSKSPKVSPGAVSLGDSETRLEVVAEKGRVLIVVGGTAFVPAMLASARKPKAKLGDGRGFSSGRARVATQQQLLAFADFALLQKLLPPEAAQGTVAANESTAFAELLLRPNTQGLDLGVHMSGETAIASGIGTLSSLAIYGTKRYLAASKTAEAKGSVFAIARGAQQAFEREGSDAASLNAAGAPIHRLCESAQAVPATVPKGAKYQPSSEKGRDYETGSPLAGWKCLKFSMVGPQFYQYDYRRGGGYKGPGRGGPNPGKDGFEISAEGDLDGDGKTSLFTITGAVDRKTNSVKLGKLFIADEFE